MRCHYPLIGITKIKKEKDKTDHSKCQIDTDKLELSWVAGGNEKWENSLAVSYKIKYG